MMNCQQNSDFREFDKIIVDFMKEHSIPGISLVLSQHGSILYTQCYGQAKAGVPLQPHHLFRIASVSKVLTAAAIMRLYERKMLSLGQRVFGHKGILPQYGPIEKGDRRISKITIKHLLQHSAGWDREIAGDPVFYKHVGQEMGEVEPVSNATLIAYMMKQKLQFNPGSKYAYSNLGYVILGRVIENVTGCTYEQFVKTILADIGITRMKLGRSHKHNSDPDEVEYHAGPKILTVKSVFPGEGEVSPPYGGYCMETGDADGGWIASPTDLLHVIHCLEGVGQHRLLGPQTFQLMKKKPKYGKGSCWYGLGLDVAWNGKAWEHGGHVDGATSSLARDRFGRTWALLCNYWPSDSDYTSLVTFAMSRVKPLNTCEYVDLTFADVATLDKGIIVKLKIHENEFQTYQQCLGQDGYQPCWINGYQINHKTFYNVIYSKVSNVSPCHVLLHNLTLDNFNVTVDSHVADGYRPIHLDSYLNSSGAPHFSVILKKCNDNTEWIMHHDLEEDKLEETVKDMKNKKYSLLCQSPVYDKVRGLLVSVLFEKRDLFSGFWSKYNIIHDRYQGDFDRHAQYGHLLSYVKSYTIPCSNLCENTEETMNTSKKMDASGHNMDCPTDELKTTDGSPQISSVHEQCNDECGDNLKRKLDLDLSQNPSNYKKVCQSNIITQQCETPQVDIDVDVDEKAHEVLFSTVWTNAGAYLYSSEHDMSPFRLLSDVMVAVQEQFVPRCVSGYEDEGGHTFVAVCTKNVGHKKK